MEIAVCFMAKVQSFKYNFKIILAPLCHYLLAAPLALPVHNLGYLYTTTLAVYIGNGQTLLLFPEKYIQEITFSSVCSGNVIALKFLMVFFLPLISKLFKKSIF